MKARGLAAILALLLFWISPASALTPMAGKACKKLGAKSTAGRTNFVCINSGKRLIWKKISAPSPTPSPAPTARPSPIPSPQPLWQQVSTDISQKVWASTPDKTPFTLYFSPTIDPNNRFIPYLTDDLYHSAAYWKALGVTLRTPLEVAFITEKDEDWWDNFKASRRISCMRACDAHYFADYKMQTFGGQVLSRNSQEASDDGSVILFFLSSEISSAQDFYWTKVMAAHELAHVVQNTLAPGKIQSVQPCWFKEGWARLYERATYSHWTDYRYQSLKADELRAFVNMAGSRGWDAAKYLEFINTYYTRSSEACRNINYGYKIGWPLSEKFHSDFGVTTMLQLIADTQKTRDWKASFINATGISEDQWLKEQALPYLIAQVKELVP